MTFSFAGLRTFLNSKSEGILSPSAECKITAIEIRINSISLTEAVLKLLPQKAQLCLLVTYAEEDPGKCYEIKSRHISFPVYFENYHDNLKVKINETVALPYFSPFPTNSAVVNIYIVQEFNDDISENVNLCSTCLDIGNSYSKFSALVKTNCYNLFLCDSYASPAGDLTISATLTRKSSVDVPPVFLWKEEIPQDFRNNEINQIFNFNKKYTNLSEKNSTFSVTKLSVDDVEQVRKNMKIKKSLSDSDDSQSDDSASSER